MSPTIALVITVVFFLFYSCQEVNVHQKRISNIKKKLSLLLYWFHFFFCVCVWLSDVCDFVLTIFDMGK